MSDRRAAASAAAVALYVLFGWEEFEEYSGNK